MPKPNHFVEEITKGIVCVCVSEGPPPHPKAIVPSALKALKDWCPQDTGMGKTRIFLAQDGHAGEPPID